MKLNERSIRWLEAELIIILAIVLLLGVLFGYSLAAGRWQTPIVEDPGTEIPMSLPGAYTEDDVI